MQARNWLRGSVCVLLLWAAHAYAQTYTVLTSLGTIAPPTGAGNLVWPLVQGFDGNFYGTAEAGGGTCANNPYATCGTAFRVSATGTFDVLHEFCQGACTDGGIPWAGLVLSPTGNFYGTTTQDLVNRGGTLFEMTPSGSITTLHSFSLADDEGTPYGPVLQADGGFYGIAGTGGSAGEGTVYKISDTGALTTLDTFTGPNGFEIPYSGAGLLELPNGLFYGVTAYGTKSGNGCGSIFQMNASGTLKTIYGFANTSQEGCGPVNVIAGPNGNLYGTAVSGGTANYGVVFELSSSGKLTVLHSFCSQSYCSDGEIPNTTLLLGTDGNFYGTTLYGGANNEGVIFQISPSGAFQVLYNFCSQFGCADGSNPNASLIQGTDGNFYGTTSDGGGSGNGGTVFKLSMGLAPFVQPAVSAGKVGSKIAILGTDLTGATSVTFDGVEAAFTVPGSTLIVATVPKGATSGKIAVRTPSETLISNVSFLVR